VQFGALRDEASAHSLAQAVRAGKASPRVAATTRVMTSVVAGTTIYRVVAGPFPSRSEAERAARETGKPYWVYEGVP
jgi:cell division septation protein DedD